MLHGLNAGRRRRNASFAAVLGIVALVASAVGFRSLSCGAVYDDVHAVFNNADVIGARPLSRVFWSDFWGTPIRAEHSNKSYRPVTILLYRFVYKYISRSEAAFHALAVFGHAVSSASVLDCASAFGLSPAAATLGALLFALHPVHTDAVFSIVGAAETLGACFAIAGVTQLRRRRPLAGLLLVLVGALTKETALFAGAAYAALLGTGIVSYILALFAARYTAKGVAPPSGVSGHGNVQSVPTVEQQADAPHAARGTVPAADRVQQQPVDAPLSSHSPFSLAQLFPYVVELAVLVTIMGLFTVFRKWIAGNAVAPDVQLLENAFKYIENSVHRRASYAVLAAYNVFLLFFPMQLSVDYSYTCFDPVTTGDDWRAWASAAVFIALAAVLVHGGARLLAQTRSLVESWYNHEHVQPDVPSQNPKGDRVMDARAQSAVEKRCEGVDHRCKNHRNSGAFVDPASLVVQHAALAAAVGVATVCFLPASNILFYTGFVVAERVLYLPSVPWCLAFGLLLAGPSRATCHGRRATRWRGVACWAAIAILCLFACRSISRTRAWDSEASIFGAAAQVCPRNSKALLNHGSALTLVSPRDALVALDLSLGIYADQPIAWKNIGAAFHLLGDWAHAAAAYERSLAMFRAHDTLGNYALLLAQQGNYAKAVEMLRESLDLVPHAAGALINYGFALARIGELEKARNSIDKSLHFEPKRALPAALCRSWIYAKLGNFSSAERVLHEAWHEHKSKADLAQNLALIYIAVRRYEDARIMANLVMKHDTARPGRAQAVWNVVEAAERADAAAAAGGDATRPDALEYLLGCSL